MALTGTHVVGDPGATADDNLRDNGINNNATNLTAEAVLARNASNLTSGTVADARLPVTAQAAVLNSTYGRLPVAAELVVFVTPRGDDASDGLTPKSAKATITAALTALGGNAGVIQIGAGTITTAATHALPGGTVIRGAGTGVTTINYTGTGTVFTSAQPGVRTYYWQMSGFLLSGPGSGGATVGIDLDSVSMAHLQDLRVEQFATGVRIRSAVNGGAVYNRITYSTLISCGIGLSIEASGSNATTVEGCRLCACTTGVKIVDSNDNTLKSCQIETNTVGAHIESTTAALADYNAMDHCRFETNTTAWETTALARDTAISFPHKFGSYTVSDLGQRTVQTNGWPSMTTSTRDAHHGGVRRCWRDSFRHHVG